MEYYSEMVIREPTLFSKKLNMRNVRDIIYDQGEKCIMGYIKASSHKAYYNFLKKNDLLSKDKEFYFYFYAIKRNHVYSHHPDVFRINKFCFYINLINKTKTYISEHILCKVQSNELISKVELVKRLNNQGYVTSEKDYIADFYYLLKIKVIDDDYFIKEMKVTDINRKNGNDTCSPHSPKIINL